MTSEAALLEALASRYAAPAWAFLRQVGNATGFATNRHLDAVAMSLWPSRGLGLHGFEIKCSRGDWRRELADPKKADDMARHLDYLWLVVSRREIIEPGELPDGWGLLAPRKVRGKESLAVVHEARRLWTDDEHADRQRIGRSFLAAVLRRVLEQRTPEAEFTRIAREAEARGVAAGKKEAEEDIADVEARHARLLERVHQFEDASGISLEDHAFRNNGRDLGTAVRVVLDGSEAIMRRMEGVARNARDIAEEAERKVAALRQDTGNASEA